MPSTTTRTTTRDAIREAAEAAGWTLASQDDTEDYYRLRVGGRLIMWAAVAYTAAGRLLSASGGRQSHALVSREWSPREAGKAESIREWLAATGELARQAETETADTAPAIKVCTDSSRGVLGQPLDPATDITAAEVMAAFRMAGPGGCRRSEPRRPGDGTSWYLRHTNPRGTYDLTRVEMPDGQLRLYASRYNGYGDDGTAEGQRAGMRFGCAWSPVTVTGDVPGPGEWCAACGHPGSDADPLTPAGSGYPVHTSHLTDARSGLYRPEPIEDQGDQSDQGEPDRFVVFAGPPIGQAGRSAWAESWTEDGHAILPTAHTTVAEAVRRLREANPDAIVSHVVLAPDAPVLALAAAGGHFAFDGDPDCLECARLAQGGKSGRP